MNTITKLHAYLLTLELRAEMQDNKLIVKSITTSETLNLIKGLNFNDLVSFEAVLVGDLTFEIRVK
jgi:hypothetical protein